MTHKISIFLIVALLLAMPVRIMSQKILSIHKADKKETIFGIAKQYGVTIDELRDANPAMREDGFVLKKGMLVNIPEHKEVAVTKKDAKADNATNAKAKTAITAKGITVGVMLPLHSQNGDGYRMAEYYRGILMAVADMKREGVSIEVNAWNVPEDADIRLTLLDKKAEECDMIFGPLYTSQVRHLADFCMNHNIRLVIPFSISGDDVATCPLIYQIYQTPAQLTAMAIEQFVNRCADSHPVFIDCNDANSKKGDFTYGLRKTLEAKNIAYSITNLNSPDDSFIKAFSNTKRNVVVLNTARSPELGQVFKKLDLMKIAVPSVRVSMFGYNEWFMYTGVYMDKFRKYDTYIPSTYNYDEASAKIRQLESTYKQQFGAPMQYALPRFALTGYDHMMYFAKGIMRYGKSFVGTSAQRSYASLQTPLVFDRVGNNGGYKNKSFLLVHFQ